MKGTKFVASALVAGMMLTGAGYAYWTDSVAISNTVSTGELDVSLSGSDVSDVSEYVTASVVNQADKAVSYRVENLYPGASFNLKTTIQNSGSIPAVVSGVSVDNTDESDTLDKSKIFVSGTVGSYNVPRMTLSAFEGHFPSAAGANLRLEPNAAGMNVNLKIELDHTLTGDQLEDTDLSQVLTVNFKQHNE
ncbi:TasA family protein [Rossellomorea aquimaris]|uniref:TasA family protein n=1 Tax=Rossellomorea aquimaris TaxID=189382 RepID=UPI0005C89F87|nr:TasA family protein [Rossellomorea aquimaris]